MLVRVRVPVHALVGDDEDGGVVVDAFGDTYVDDGPKKTCWNWACAG